MAFLQSGRVSALILIAFLTAIAGCEPAATPAAPDHPGHMEGDQHSAGQPSGHSDGDGHAARDHVDGDGHVAGDHHADSADGHTDPHPHVAGAKHTHGSPHGGAVMAAGAYHVELVSGAPTRVYLLDEHESSVPVEGVTGTVTAPGEGGLKSTALTVVGDHLEAATLVGDAPAVVTLQVRGQVVSARFAKGSAPASEPASQPARAVTLALTSDPAMPMATKPATYTFRFSYADTGEAIGSFDVVHEKKLHVFVVSADMAFFDHVHPTLGADGSFTLPQTVPFGGDYRVFADFTSGGVNHLTTVPVKVGGPARPKVAPLAASSSMSGTWSGLTAALKPSPNPVTSGEEVALDFVLTDAKTGQPVRDLEPYLGALGHMVLLHEDGQTYVHAHPKHDGASPAHDHGAHGHEAGNHDDGDSDHDAAPKQGGPEVSFAAHFPKPGLYKLWAQFQRNGTVVTVDYVIAVR